MKFEGGDMETEKGFSLIEVLIAATIFSIGLIALAGAQLVSIRSTQSNYNFTMATSLVQQQIEDLHAGGSAALVNGSDGPLDMLGRTAADYVNPPDAANFLFNRTWTCTPANPGTGNPCLVHVEVRWLEARTGNNRMVSSDAIITP
jgi:prepilin-type N-terminal cleavage/methylation domain-containing protein